MNCDNIAASAKLDYSHKQESLMVSKAGLTVVLYGQAPDTAVFRDFRAKLKSLVDKNKIKLVWLDGGVTA